MCCIGSHLSWKKLITNCKRLWLQMFCSGAFLRLRGVLAKCSGANKSKGHVRLFVLSLLLLLLLFFYLFHSFRLDDLLRRQMKQRRRGHLLVTKPNRSTFFTQDVAPKRVSSGEQLLLASLTSWIVILTLWTIVQLCWDSVARLQNVISKNDLLFIFDFL